LPHRALLGLVRGLTLLALLLLALLLLPLGLPAIITAPSDFIFHDYTPEVIYFLAHQLQELITCTWPVARMPQLHGIIIFKALQSV
jgi:hypothetical protein